MDMNHIKNEMDSEKLEQIERGKRIKEILEEMKVPCIIRQFQFLGLVEEGKGNLVYKSIKKLRTLSGHSADYILYGLDDNIIKEAKKCLKNYSEEEIINAINIIKNISIFIKNN